MGARRKLTRTVRAEQRKEALHIKQLRMLGERRSPFFRLVESAQLSNDPTPETDPGRVSDDQHRP